MGQCCEWLFSRIWLDSHKPLNNAFDNFRFVARDFLNLFELHIDPESRDRKILETKRFYKISEYNEKLYHRLLNEYNEHELLVNDLFFELTRAANYICDKVRECVDDSFRMKEGALYVLRWNVGFRMETLHVRPEYKGKERCDVPYPGLSMFKKIRYKRDYALDPNPPQPPLF
jgi:hypothetical protein